jgi:hypothetical protein
LYINSRASGQGASGGLANGRKQYETVQDSTRQYKTVRDSTRQYETVREVSAVTLIIS